MFDVMKFCYLPEASLIAFMLYKLMIYLLLLKDFLNICLYSVGRMNIVLIINDKSKFIVKMWLCKCAVKM